jgi:nitric oxide reductase subunit B
MATQLEAPASYPSDSVSNVLKWILLIVAIATFVTLGVAVVNTYKQAPPQPNLYVAANGVRVMTGDDIVAGKAGFQKADLMDYGSLYGMGSYFPLYPSQAPREQLPSV